MNPALPGGRPEGGRRHRLFAASALIVAGLGLALLLQHYERLQFGALPDMSGYSSAAERKSAFYRYLQPIIDFHNQRILQARKRLLKVESRAAIGELSWWDRRWLRATAQHYQLAWQDIPAPELISRLTKRVDILPVSLALVQAAKESGWGRSRFAVEGNALFGQWCYRDGCGMVPQRRPSEARHEVQRFASVSDAVAAYLHNINTDERYRPLRDIRQQLRQAGREPDGLSLAEGLLFYSQRRQDYVEEVKKMILQYRALRRNGALG